MPEMVLKQAQYPYNNTKKSFLSMAFLAWQKVGVHQTLVKAY